MNSLLAAYWIQLRVVMATQLQYRIEISLWLLYIIIQPVVYIALWSAVARMQNGAVDGFTPAEFAGYFIIVMLLRHATFSWVIFGLSERIRHGWLSQVLLRPIHPIHGDLAENLSYKVVTLAVIVPTATVLIVILRPTIHPTPWMIVAFIPALFMACALRFLIEWTVGLGSFWTTRMTAINQVYDVALLFLSGQIAPLMLFPGWVQAVAAVLPFRWIIAFPVELLLGRLTTAQILMGLAVQATWLALSVGFFKLVWRVGIRRYSAVGA